MLFLSMMKKNYIYPITEILPFCAVHSLCGSGGGDSGSGGDNVGGGGDPEELGRATRRVFF